MMTLRNVKRAILMLALVVIPMAVPSAQEVCYPFLKQVSVDGGTTWLDADDEGTAAEQVVGGAVQYRFIVTNCERNKFCYDTSIDDPTLSINDVPVPTVNTDNNGEPVIIPGEVIVITQTTPDFGNLLQPGRCDTPGIKENTATETTYVEGNRDNAEIMMDKAFVNCVASDKASLGDRVWLDVDGDGIQNCTVTDDATGAVGDTCTDTGVDGVLVDLGTADGSACTLDGPSTTTMNGGFYLFTDLEPGNYCVRFTDPEGRDCTLFNQGSDPALDSDGQVLGASCLTGPISLEAGETNLTVDLGLVPPATPVSLGDRVWEDLDRDGDQDCLDTNGNGIVGDTGDSGAECGSGIPFIPVDLFLGDCATGAGSTTTDANGFYHFDNLIPGEYCVKFQLPDENFCDTDGFDLGAPKFTAKDDGDSDVTDSDAHPDGSTDSISLGSNDNITIDAGIFCPAKIGDLVFLDNNGNGKQDGGEGVEEGVKTTLFECGPDMIAGTPDDVMTDEMRFTDASGMYMYGAEDGYDLPPGKYFVKFDRPLGLEFTTPNAGPDNLDSDCHVQDDGLAAITACTDLTASRSINLDRDCGLVPPPPPNCDLTLEKQCRVEAPPPQDFDKCDGKLQQFTLLWTGAGPITASGPNNSVSLSTGEEATFVGPFSDNDVPVSISGAVSGMSKFHVSCSDVDFNDPSDCGKLAGNGKSNESGLINDWKLEGFIDDSGRVLDCHPDSGGDGFADNCTFSPQPLPTCENGEKPDNLRWRYDGGTGGDGDCADSTFFTIVNEDGKMHEDFECSGSVDAGLQITAVDDDGNAFTVNPGESFTTLRDDIKNITLTDSMGSTQELVFHTSCSQPLEAQATAGALTLAALDGRDGGQDMTYRYDVANNGDPLTNVSIEDNELGTIASGFGLDSDTGASFDVMTQIFGTTTNTAFASGTLADGTSCSPESAADSVTIEAVTPACSLGVELYKVEDDQLKIKVTNNDSRGRTVTLESMTVNFPAARGDVKKVKLDGDAYKRDDSSNPVNGTPATFGPADWTEDEVKKRQIKPGDTEKLEIEWTDKGEKDDLFTLTLSFGDGCVYDLQVVDQELTVL